MAEIFTVPIKGVGKPDYSREISVGRVRPGLALKYNQTLSIVGLTASTIASPYPWVRAPVAAGAQVHLVLWSTGVPTPYTLAKGYTLTIVQNTASFDQDSNTLLYLDGFFVAHLGTTSGGIPQVRQDIIGFSTILFDPTGASPHLVDAVITNLGGDVMQGSCSLILILEKVGSPPLPSEKTVRCKFCGHEWVVPLETTAINCPKCGQLNIYCDFSRFRSTD